MTHKSAIERFALNHILGHSRHVSCFTIVYLRIVVYGKNTFRANGNFFCCSLVSSSCNISIHETFLPLLPCPSLSHGALCSVRVRALVHRECFLKVLNGFINLLLLFLFHFVLANVASVLSQEQRLHLDPLHRVGKVNSKLVNHTSQQL